MNGFQTFFSSGDVGAHTESLQSRDDDSQALVPAATTSGTSESATAAAASTSDKCCEVCLVAPRAGFALVPCGHARSLNLVLCACHIWKRDALFVVRILPW